MSWGTLLGRLYSYMKEIEHILAYMLMSFDVFRSKHRRKNKEYRRWYGNGECNKHINNANNVRPQIEAIRWNELSVSMITIKGARNVYMYSFLAREYRIYRKQHRAFRVIWLYIFFFKIGSLKYPFEIKRFNNR